MEVGARGEVSTGRDGSVLVLHAWVTLAGPWVHSNARLSNPY